jgi:hypothetical protein
VKHIPSKVAPLLFGIGSWFVFIAPELIGCLLRTGVSLGPWLSVIWIGCTLVLASAGLLFGIQVARSNPSVGETLVISVGMLLSVSAGLLMLGMLNFLVTGGG